MGIKEAIASLSKVEKAVLTLVVAVLPPVIVLLQEQSTNPFLYAASVAGGVLAFAVKMLDSQ